MKNKPTDLNLARAYLSLDMHMKHYYRKVRKRFFKSRSFQMALTQAGNENRLALWYKAAVQGLQAKKAKVEGKIGNHCYLAKFDENPL